MELSDEKVIEDLRGFGLALKQVREVVLNYVISLLKNPESKNASLTLLTKLEELDEFVLETAGSRIREICHLLKPSSKKVPSTTKGGLTERGLIVPDAEDDLIDRLKLEPCGDDDVLPFAISPLVQGACGCRFVNKRNLSKHIENVHQGVRPFKCNFPECEKAFKMKTHLQYHLKTHENPGSRQRGLNKPRDHVVRIK